MSEKFQSPDDLSFPNAKPVQLEKAPPIPNPPIDPLSFIPVVPLNPSTITTPTCKPRQNPHPRQPFTKFKNIIKFKHKTQNLLHQLGFTDFFFQNLPTPTKTNNPLTTLPSQLQTFYKKEKLHHHDLALQHVNSTHSPIFMSTIEDFILNATIKPDTFHRYTHLINTCKHFGYHDFYYTPLKSQDGDYHTLLAVTTKALNTTDFKRLVQDQEGAFQLLAEALYVLAAREFPDIFRDTQSRSTPLSHRRPIQLLELMAKEDLALKQVADRLCIAIDTVNKHMAAAKRLLGVRTQTGAVYRAIKTGLISTDK